MAMLNNQMVITLKKESCVQRVFELTGGLEKTAWNSSGGHFANFCWISRW